TEGGQDPRNLQGHYPIRSAAADWGHHGDVETEYRIVLDEICVRLL
ncbi:uncharacterized protein METZ01_LOCUS507389, partial [marine metagenome]